MHLPDSFIRTKAILFIAQMYAERGFSLISCGKTWLYLKLSTLLTQGTNWYLKFCYKDETVSLSLPLRM